MDQTGSRTGSSRQDLSALRAAANYQAPCCLVESVWMFLVPVLHFSATLVFPGCACEQLEILEGVESDVGSVRQPNGKGKQKKHYSLESQVHFYPHVTLMKEHVCV